MVCASERSTTRAGSSGGASVGMSNEECIGHATRVYGHNWDGSETQPGHNRETPAVTRCDVHTMHTARTGKDAVRSRYGTDGGLTR